MMFRKKYSNMNYTRKLQKKENKTINPFPLHPNFAIHDLIMVFYPFSFLPDTKLSHIKKVSNLVISYKTMFAKIENKMNISVIL